MYQIYAFPSINPNEVDDTLILLAKSLQKVNIEFVVNNYEKRMTYFSNLKNMSGISMRITLTNSRDALELKKIIQHVAYNPGAVIFSGYRTKDYKMYFSQSPYISLETANKKKLFSKIPLFLTNNYLKLVLLRLLREAIPKNGVKKIRSLI